MSRTVRQGGEQWGGGLYGVSGSGGPEPSWPPGTASGPLVLLPTSQPHYCGLGVRVFPSAPHPWGSAPDEHCRPRIIQSWSVSCSRGPGGVLGDGLGAYVISSH